MAIGNQFPTSLEPIGRFGDNDVPVTVEVVWYQFFQSMAALLADVVGGVLGFTVVSGATAAGTTQGTALPMTTEWLEVTTTPVNAGVLLHNFGAGVPSSVFNEGANTLSVYPPVGSKIDAQPANTPYLLASGKMQTFFQTGTTRWRSTQLG